VTTSNEFRQTDAISHHVFPLAAAEETAEGLSLKQILGSGFFIADGGLGMTADHVVKACPPEAHVVAMMRSVDEGGWWGIRLELLESHPSEDVCVFKLSEDDALATFLRPSLDWCGSSASYELWGYPEAVYYELGATTGSRWPRPDLIYSRGHVRRRTSGVPLPGIRGTHFLELSEVAGPGCSGSPVILREPRDPSALWKVVGIYVGEQIGSVGYAARLDNLAEWHLEAFQCSFNELALPNPTPHLGFTPWPSGTGSRPPAPDR
jgi:trypsin-like peptidase